MAEESHRLKPMVEGYDQQLFNELYEKTTQLRKALVHGIDPKRFGVDREELLSWFSVKFIYIFNKYYQEKPDKLLGYIINGLKTYKRRLILEAYQKKNEIFATNAIEDHLGHGEFEEQRESGNIDETMYGIEDPTEDKEYLLDIAMKYLKQELSDNAMFVLEITLNPPPYILARLDEEANLNRIPDSLIAQYMGLKATDTNLQYIASLKSEIKQGIKKASQANSTGSIYQALN